MVSATSSPLDLDALFETGNAAQRLARALPDLTAEFGIRISNNWPSRGRENGQCCLCQGSTYDWSEGCMADDLCEACAETKPYGYRRPRQLTQFYTPKTVRVSRQFHFVSDVIVIWENYRLPQALIVYRFIALKLEGKVELARISRRLNRPRHEGTEASFYSPATGKPLGGGILPAIHMTYARANILYGAQRRW